MPAVPNAMSRLFLFLFSILKFGKLLGTGGTMLIAMALYALVFGWKYAVGFVLMLFIHELGHFIAARKRGLRAGLPTFIPFLGAWTELKDQPHDAETEAFVGLGGPLLGTVAALACYWAARNWELSWLLAVAYSGFFLNLINLIPVSPLDGGRIMAVVSPRIWLLGAPIIVYMAWRSFSPIWLIIGIFAVPYVLQALRFDRQSAEHRAYYDVPMKTRWEYAGYYLLLLVFLAVMVNEVNGQLAHLGAPPAASAAGTV